MVRRRSQGTPVERRIGPVADRASASSAVSVPDPLDPLPEDRLAGQQLVVLVGAGIDRVADDVDVVLPAVGEVGRRRRPGRM